MATVPVATALPIPGLDQPLKAADMGHYGNTYNGLQSIGKLSVILQKHLNALLNIIRLHKFERLFGFHLQHRHSLIPNDTVRVETAIGIAGGTWTKAVPVAELDVDPAKLHPTQWKLDGATMKLVPVEFAAGPSPADGAIDLRAVQAFVVVFAAYLVAHDLTNHVSLQMSDYVVNLAWPVTTELEVSDDGGVNDVTVVLPCELVVCGGDSIVSTGWNVLRADVADPNDPAGPLQAGEVYAPKIQGTHQVFITKQNGMKIEDMAPKDLLQQLIDAGAVMPKVLEQLD